MDTVANPVIVNKSNTLSEKRNCYRPTYETNCIETSAINIKTPRGKIAQIHISEDLGLYLQPISDDTVSLPIFENGGESNDYSKLFDSNPIRLNPVNQGQPNTIAAYESSSQINSIPFLHVNKEEKSFSSDGPINASDFIITGSEHENTSIYQGFNSIVKQLSTLQTTINENTMEVNKFKEIGVEGKLQQLIDTITLTSEGIKTIMKDIELLTNRLSAIENKPKDSYIGATGDSNEQKKWSLRATETTEKSVLEICCNGKVTGRFFAEHDTTKSLSTLSQVELQQQTTIKPTKDHDSVSSTQQYNVQPIAPSTSNTDNSGIKMSSERSSNKSNTKPRKQGDIIVIEATPTPSSDITTSSGTATLSKRTKKSTQSSGGKPQNPIELVSIIRPS